MSIGQRMQEQTIHANDQHGDFAAAPQVISGGVKDPGWETRDITGFPGTGRASTSGI